MKAGKYIFEGSYGCAFNPALPCVKTGKRKGLGKVFNNVFDFKTEEKIQKFINKIDPDHEATVPYYGSCRVDLEKIRKADEMNKCNIADELSISKRSLNQLMFRFGGDDLDKITNSMKQSNKYVDLYFDTLISSLLPILKSIVKIAKYGYVHSDIKPPNMLYNKKGNRLYLIDFGLLQKQRYIIHSDSALSFKYLYYPPEFIMIHYLRRNVNNPTTLLNYVIENFGFYNYEVFLDYLDFAEYKKKLDTFITYITTTPLVTIEKDFQKIYIKKLDVYSLGMSYVELMYITLIDKTFKVKNKDLYDKFVNNILIDMIHPDPRYRLTPDEAYIRLNCLFRTQKLKVKETDIVDFLDIKNIKNMIKTHKLEPHKDKQVMYDTLIKNRELLIK